MTQFITLHTSADEELHMNPDHIVFMWQQGENQTTIQTPSRIFVVKESTSAILLQLNMLQVKPR